ncbi:MAG TPA: tetratricopeptide repeat protein, partial [Gemmatimonadales bacterium]
AAIERRLRPMPDDAKVLATLALAYTHLGRHADAIRTGERAAELLPVESDAVSGPFVLAYLARVYASAGRHDKATAVLERLMATNSWITPAELRADPIWEPLRGYAGFRKLAGEQDCHPERSEGSCRSEQDPSLRSG